MKSSSPVRNGAAPQTASPILTRIAAALGEKEDAFLEGAGSESTLREAHELLQIWDELGHAADRRKLLTFARALAPGRLPA